MSFLQSLKQRYLAPLEFVRPGGYAEIWRIAWPLIAMNASNVVMLLLNRAFGFDGMIWAQPITEFVMMIASVTLLARFIRRIKKG